MEQSQTMNPGIFENELGREVQREFKRLMDEGFSSYSAAERILKAQGSRVHDLDDGQEIYFALAALQLEQGALSPAIRKRALTLINSGEALERWTGRSAEIYEKRKAVEQDLRARLVAIG